MFESLAPFMSELLIDDIIIGGFFLDITDKELHQGAGDDEGDGDNGDGDVAFNHHKGH